MSYQVNLPGAAAPVPENPQKREAVEPDGQSVHKEAHRISSHSIETILEHIDA